jgi:hypothetical protein
MAELMTFIPPDDGDFERLREAYKAISEGTHFVQTALQVRRCHAILGAA